MNLAEAIARVPRHTDADGIVRVAGTRPRLERRISVDTAATCFLNGSDVVYRDQFLM